MAQPVSPLYLVETEGVEQHGLGVLVSLLHGLVLEHRQLGRLLRVRHLGHQVLLHPGPGHVTRLVEESKIIKIFIKKTFVGLHLGSSVL